MACAEGRTLLIASSDPGCVARLAREIGARARVRTAADGREALEMALSGGVDVLAAELTLGALDAAALFEALRESDLPRLPWAVGLAQPGMELMSERARRAGACRVLVRPTGGQLLAACEELGPLERLCPAAATTQRAERLLWSLGFSAGMRGTGYLAIAARACASDGRLMERLTEEVYPLVAREAGVSAQQAQHAIRRAIERAWSGGPQDHLYALFGNTIDAKQGKPTAGGMIARVAQLLRTGMEIAK